MQIAETRNAVAQIVHGWRLQGESIAFVPTMGNLHEGHLALVRKAATLANRVVASIYVNPTQFGEGEDFDRYPRTPDRDLASLEAEHCDLVFMPPDSEMYPFGLAQSVRLGAPPELAGRLEGASRAGHFDGVVTVVARLFAIVRPDIAVFGEKDYQQLLVIRRMSDDIGFGINVVGAPTIRDEHGLALSSRNAFLGGEENVSARLFNRVLQRAAGQVAAGGEIHSIERAACAELEHIGLDVDYVAIRRADDLADPGPGDTDLRILAAVRCGDTRLIDNMAVPDTHGEAHDL